MYICSAAEIEYRVPRVEAKKQILVYLHVAGSVTGVEILEEYVKAMRISNLYDFADRLFVGLLGSEEAVREVSYANDY
jgi:hypothetical protein